MTLLATTAIAQFAPRQVLVADRDNGSTHGLPLAQKPRRRRITILAVAALDAPYAACESHERCAHLADRGKSRTITSIKTGYCQPGWRSGRGSRRALRSLGRGAASAAPAQLKVRLAAAAATDPASPAVPLAPARAAWQPQRPHPAPSRALGRLASPHLRRAARVLRWDSKREVDSATRMVSARRPATALAVGPDARAPAHTRAPARYAHVLGCLLHGAQESMPTATSRCAT